MGELDISPGVNVVRYLALSRGKSGSSWLARFLTMHGCSFDAYENACPVLHTELASHRLSLAPGSFFTERVKKLLNRNDTRATGNETIDMTVYRIEEYAKREYVGFGVQHYVEESLQSAQRRSEIARRCTSFAYGGKCNVDFGASIEKDETQQRLRALLTSSSPGYFREPPGKVFNTAVHSSILNQTVNIPKLVDSLKHSLNTISRIGAILRNISALAGAPFLEVVYEDLCTSPNALNELFGFLSLPSLSVGQLLSIERSLPLKSNKALLRKRISNYEDLKVTLESASLAHLLCIEECTLGIRFGVAPSDDDSPVI